MSLKSTLGIFWFSICFPLVIANTGEAGRQVPKNLFNIGDSIGEGEAVYGVIGVKNHDAVWSTGFNLNDIVYSLNERFEDACPEVYNENDATRDTTFNHAVSGATIHEFASQASEFAAAGSTPSGKTGMVTILLGNNDVCAPSLEAMTPPEQFETQYCPGLDILSESNITKNAYIHVSSIPAIYWL